jgi:hypothetical protein
MCRGVHYDAFLGFQRTSPYILPDDFGLALMWSNEILMLD